ncbi:hypothetical protein IWX64_003434 [Arthrobacter sp. CAN_A212]
MELFVFPKRGQVWTYRERTRFLSFMWTIPALGFTILGLYLGVTDGSWTVLVLAVVLLGFIGSFFAINERKYRGEP